VVQHQHPQQVTLHHALGEGQVGGEHVGVMGPDEGGSRVLWVVETHPSNRQGNRLDAMAQCGVHWVCCLHGAARVKLVVNSMSCALLAHTAT
jgi:hypothetical protein